MPRSFDPDKARSDAKATIASAKKRKEALQAKVDAAEASLVRVTERRDAAKEKVAAVDGEIARAQRYLDLTSNLNAPAEETAPDANPEPASAF